MSSGTEAIDRKQRIRDRYRGVDTSELEVIPAKIVEGLGESTSIRRVAAYVRVSTDNDEQTSSYELQKNYYQIAVQVCSATDAGAHRVGKLNEFSSCEIKCVAFVRMVYKNAKWNKHRSYRMIGNPFSEQRLVSFQIQEALPIENGRVLDGTVSPTFALRRAEGSPSQNNPTPEEKADSGAV